MRVVLGLLDSFLAKTREVSLAVGADPVVEDAGPPVSEGPRVGAVDADVLQPRHAFKVGGVENMEEL
jgi:hypothetical protein